MKTQLVTGFILSLMLGIVCMAQDAAPSPTPAPKARTGMNKRQVERQLVRYENEFWEAWKNKNPRVFRNRLTPDGFMVGEDGINNNSEVIKAIGAEDCEVKSYKLSGFKTVMLGANTAVLAFKGEQEGTCAGTPLPKVVWGSSTYVRRNGKWLAAMHQETPAHEMPAK